MTASLGPSLTSAPPDIADDAVVDLLAKHFGLQGGVRRLTSERDLNLALSSATQRYVVKFANLSEPRLVTDLQTAALLYLENKGLPVPLVIRSLTGATEVETPAGLLRVLSYLEGVPMHLAPPGLALCHAMGGMAARLVVGLTGFCHPGADHVLQWDIKQAAALRPLLPSVPDDLQVLCTRVLDRFDAEIAAQLADLPWAVVHNDLNPHNVLVSPDAPDKIVGVLDFGDMVRTPRVCDLAVAASYQIDPAAALSSLATFTAAYHATLPLTRAEVMLIADLTATRMLTTIAIASWRAAQYPENADYILRNMPSARAGLCALSDLPRTHTTETLLRACAMEPL